MACLKDFAIIRNFVTLFHTAMTEQQISLFLVETELIFRGARFNRESECKEEDLRLLAVISNPHAIGKTF